MQTISATEAAKLQANGAVIIDIRSTQEYARKHIDGAKSIPMTEMNSSTLPQEGAVLFCCLSGVRTQSNSAALDAISNQGAQAYLIEGGLNAWEKAGLKTIHDPSQVIDVMRQVQITAGFLILLGVLLGTYVNPGFYWLSAFVGAGLMFAGITGFCGMAKLLMLMPWNQQS